MTKAEERVRMNYKLFGASKDFFIYTEDEDEDEDEDEQNNKKKISCL